MNRQVQSELLDQLPAHDPRAIRSRRDLRRVNFLMGNVRFLADAVRPRFNGSPPGRIVDLGAGDGTLMLRLARRLSARWRNVQVALVDRQAIVSAETCRQFDELSWNATVIGADVFDWLARPSNGRVDLITTNLFLHHFCDSTLARLLPAVAQRTNCFAACEPRRYLAALGFSRSLWLIGGNAVTRHDAAASVRAGFKGAELSALWPRNGEWQLLERAVGPFSHCFVAHRFKNLVGPGNLSNPDDG